MTPERAVYHRLMLLAGFHDEYERELDQALELLDPIPEPELSLACCMSDLDQTASVLYNYTLEHPADHQQVYDLLLGEVRRRYVGGELTAEAVCERLSIFQQILRQHWDFADLWLDLYSYLYDYELFDEGLISREVFVTAFDSLFLHGKQLDAWQLQKEQNKKKSIWDFFCKSD